MAGELSDLILDDDGHVRFVGVTMSFENPAGSSRIPVYGALEFQGSVVVARPPAPPSDARRRAPPRATGDISVVAGGLGGTGSTFALGMGAESYKPAGDVTAFEKKVGSVFTRLTIMRKTPDLYNLYEAIDALVEAVLELNRR